MIKIILVLSTIMTFLSAEGVAKEEKTKNPYVDVCVDCHKYQPVSLENAFMDYLKAYSGEYSFKGSLKAFLKNPTNETSLMSNIFLDRFSVKNKTELSDAALDEALDTYWNLYNVRNKLK